MQYLLLIYQNETEGMKMDKAAMAEVHREYQEFVRSVAQSGALKSNHGLQPTSTATTVRVRDGKTLATDGPFAETREQLGGYFLIEAKNLDEAIAVAERIPSARWGSIEVRPVWQ